MTRLILFRSVCWKKAERHRWSSTALPNTSSCFAVSTVCSCFRNIKKSFNTTFYCSENKKSSEYFKT